MSNFGLRISEFGFRIIKATGRIELGVFTHERRGGISELEIRIAEFRAQRQKRFSHAGGGAGEAECDSDDD